jgi:hypothetical protein
MIAFEPGFSLAYFCVPTIAMSVQQCPTSPSIILPITHRITITTIIPPSSWHDMA